MSARPSIREAADADLPAIQAIYAQHVLHGAGTFEEEPPAVEEIARRLDAVRANALPWLVAEMADGVAGYAYAQRYHARSGWRMTLEDSVYVAQHKMQAGVGRALLDELVNRCSRLHYSEMIAVIGDSANAGSIRLHAAAGFVHAGLLRNVGLKFDRALDVVLMQRTLK